jgi:hypothetical protein
LMPMGYPIREIRTTGTSPCFGSHLRRTLGRTVAEQAVDLIESFWACSRAYRAES